MTIALSREEARERLSRIGKSAHDVARELGVDKQTVIGVLNGHLKGRRGDAHKVAVALGMKNGIIVEDGVSLMDAMRAAA